MWGSIQKQGDSHVSQTMQKTFKGRAFAILRKTSN